MGRKKRIPLQYIGVREHKTKEEMIVVHPNDPSTRMLSEIYNGIEGVTVFDSWEQREDILKAIAAAPKDEPILLLGHGCPSGLLDMRHGLVIKDSDADLLKDRPNLVGIWCYASSYAFTHGHKGFFSGMFISELPEAFVNCIDASEEEIDDNAWNFSIRFGRLLREGVPLRDIAGILMDPCYIDSDLTEFNYSRLTWRPQGDEPLPPASAVEYF